MSAHIPSSNQFVGIIPSFGSYQENLGGFTSVDLVVAPLVWFFLEHKTKTIVEQDIVLINYAL